MDALGEILLELENPLETTRARAVINLVRYNHEKAIPHLERAANKDESPQVRYLARKGLKLLRDRALEEDQGQGKTEFLAADVAHAVSTLVTSADANDRRNGFKLAANLNNPELYPMLEEAYDKEDALFLKPMMVHIMAIIGGQKARRHVEAALGSPEHRLRASAVEAAALLQDKMLLNKVVPLLRDDDHRVAANAALALKDYGSIRMMETLDSMLASEDVNRRDSAVYALSEMRDDMSLPLLVKASRDPVKSVRAKAEKGLENLAAEGSVPAAEILQKIRSEDDEDLTDFFVLAGADSATSYLAHEDFSVRLKAVKDILKADDRTRLPAVKEALGAESDTFVKSSLVRAIGELGSEDDLETIIPFLIDREPRVRANAVEATGILTSSEEWLTKLLPSLRDSNNRVRANAAVALKDSHPLEAMSTLREMAAESDVRMKLSAAYACLEIGTDPAAAILGNLARERDLRVSEKALTALAMLQDRGNQAANRIITKLEETQEGLISTDSFVAFDDGSVIQLSPDSPPATLDAGPPPADEASFASSLKLEYNLKAGVELPKPLPSEERPPSSRERVFDGRADHPTLTSGIRTRLGSKTDKYVLAGEVGRGGMGIILNAFDTDIRREVAMKIITGRRSEAREFLERFVEEAQVQGQLEHPNICPVHDLGVDPNGRIYFTMKMVKGSSLAEMIKETRRDESMEDPRWLTEVLNIFLKICDGIAFSHSRGVIHRDLKPDNIMIGDFGEVYVMDWGLAKIVGTEDVHHDELIITDRSENVLEMKTMTGSVVGTPAYMPPEQSKGVVEEMDERSDIYSLGALLYELLTLEHPFTGKTPWDIMEKVNSEQPEPPGLRTPQRRIPPELDAVVLKCLEKDKDDRYQSVRELKQEIELFLSGRPIGAMEYSLWQVCKKWVGRNRVLASSILAVLLVIVTSAAVAYFNMSRSRTSEANARVQAEQQKQIAEKNEQAAKEAQNQTEKQWARAEVQKREADKLRAQAFEQKKKAEQNRELAETKMREAQVQMTIAQKNLLESRLSQARFLSERNEPGEAVKELRAIRQDMEDHLVPPFPFVDLLTWKASHIDGRSIRVVDALEKHIALKGPISCVAINPAGTMAAAGDSTGRLVIWDLEKKSASVLKQHDNSITGLTFSPDGKRLAFGDTNLTVSLWDVAAGKLLFDIVPHLEITANQFQDTINTLAFSPDGKVLAFGTTCDTLVHLYDLEHNRELEALTGHLECVYSVAFSPDGRLLASGSRDKQLTVWDMKSRKSNFSLYGHRGMITGVTFSPDGTLLASSGIDGSIRLWDPATGDAKGIFSQQTSYMTSLSFSPDGNRLVSGSTDGAVRFWDLIENEEMASFKEHVLNGQKKRVNSVVFSPDGRRVLSGGADGSVKLWSLEPGQHLRTFSISTFNVARLAFSPDSKTLAVGTRADLLVPILLLDIDTGEWRGNLAGHSGSAEALDFSPDGKLLASGGKNSTFRIWKLPEQSCLAAVNIEKERPEETISILFGKVLSRYVTGSVQTHQDLVCDVSFSPDGKLVAAGVSNGMIKFWDVAEQKITHTYTDCKAAITTATFSPRGHLLAAAGWENDIFLWDTRTNKLITRLKGHSQPVRFITFSADGRLLASTSLDGTIMLWDIDKMQGVGIFRGHVEGVRTAAFSPDGRLLATGSMDSNIMLWDVRTKQHLFTLKGHQGIVVSVVFSPDGRLMASGGFDHTVKIWQFGDALKPFDVEWTPIPK